MAAAKIEAALKGKFIGGEKPNAEDVKLFNELLGEKNTYLHRWAKNMASFSEAERKAWAPAKKAAKPAVSFSTAAAAPAAPVATKAKVTAEIALKEGVNGADLEKLIRTIKIDGLDFGAFAAKAGALVWTPTIEEVKVSREDLLDMTQGFAKYVTKTTFSKWEKL
eukprot:TRINITY_DN13792_c0_g1_i1.p1 TRINITY_DN13792_c0_g1~~TRINITY_DN13792_c0_g1_i1.p1  ORF type:complete len:165 (+),score=75.64 TRINITY_DN13792_c0_g1_i1:57-551(+)